LINKEDTEDVVAITFRKVFENINRFKPEGNGSLGKWIVTIAINEAIRHLSTRDTLVLYENYNSLDIQTQEDFDCDVDFEFLLTLIDQMPEGYRIVFNMYVMEKYTHAEIAEILGISISTSKSQLHKARGFLMKQLQKNKIYEMGRY
jgi:RNA polymerase sigma-70 factor (ECF subfamily)